MVGEKRKVSWEEVYEREGLHVVRVEGHLWREMGDVCEVRHDGLGIRSGGDVTSWRCVIEMDGVAPISDATLFFLSVELVQGCYSSHAPLSTEQCERMSHDVSWNILICL